MLHFENLPRVEVNLKNSFHSGATLDAGSCPFRNMQEAV